MKDLVLSILFIVSASLIIPSLTFGETQQDKEPKPDKLLKVGNLAFPVSQQPTPLVSFGQNLIEEKQVDVQVQVSEFQGKEEDQYFIDISNSIIYGFKDNFSIFINVPNAIRYRNENHRSSGPADLVIQLEYAPYTQEHETYYDQISLVANVTIPTGSAKKNPPTGVGANSFFIGGVYSTMGINWFYFTSYGGIFNGSSHRTQFGNQFLYEYGVGRRIFSNSDWLMDWMIEFDGLYATRDKIEGERNRNSGGNIIYVTPSIFLASKEHFTFQVGVGFPIVQKLFGHQKKQEHSFQTKISWKF